MQSLPVDTTEQLVVEYTTDNGDPRRNIRIGSRPATADDVERHLEADGMRVTSQRDEHRRELEESVTEKARAYADGDRSQPFLDALRKALNALDADAIPF